MAYGPLQNHVSFTNIPGLHWNFTECECLLESSSSDVLALCETKLYDLVDSGNFSVRTYLPLIWKDSVTHMHGLTVYVKKGLPFDRNLSLEISADCCVFDWLYLIQCLLLFSLLITFCVFKQFLMLFHLT